MSELTDRYIGTTLRSIPEKQKTDIEAELRASIDDAVEARVATGESADTAEKEVLTDLGDPDRLAAGYTGRPGYLIGPELFFDYKRLLTALLVTVVPIVAVVIAVLEVIAGEGVGGVIGSTVGLVISLVVHIAFWTTLVFAFVERDSGERAKEWSLGDLPVAPTRGSISFGDTIASVVFLVLVIATLIFSRTVSPVTDASGEAVPFFDPAMWDFWLPFLIGVLLLEIVFELIKYRVGEWTWTLASVNLALNVGFAIPAIYLLATDQMLNPALWAELGWSVPTVGTAGVTIAIVTIAGVFLFDIVDAFRKTRK